MFETLLNFLFGPVNTAGPNTIVTHGYEVRALAHLMKTYGAELTVRELERFKMMNVDRRRAVADMLAFTPVELRCIEMIEALRESGPITDERAKYLFSSFNNPIGMNWVRDLRPLFIEVPRPEMVE